MTQRCALIGPDGKVASVIIADPASYQPAAGFTLELGDSVAVGDTWNGTAFVKPVAPLPTAAQLKDLAAAERWQFETGGVTLANGMQIATDPVAQAKIAAAKTAFDNGTLTGTIAFKAANGWFSASAAEVTAVYAAVVAHVQRGYSIERDVVGRIEAQTVTTADQVSAAFAAG